MNLYGSPCFSSVFDSRRMFASGFFWLNFYFVFRNGSFVYRRLLFLSSSSFRIESMSSSFVFATELLLFMSFFLSTILKGFESYASCLRVCLNFYFVALKTSILLSSFTVSSFGPFGCSSNTTSLPMFYDTLTVTPLKYSCFKILNKQKCTLQQLASFGTSI